ncbi:MAG: hypothetical protein ACRDFW_04605 [bacterium]
MRERKEERGWWRQARIVLGGCGVGLLLGVLPVSVFAGDRIALLRLEETGEVREINPNTLVVFKDLDTYLSRRLSGKKILEVRQQECRDGGKSIILIRYEE